MDNAWVVEWLPRLGKAIDDGDVLARISLLSEARGHPNGNAVSMTAEFLLSKYDVKAGGEKVAIEIAEMISAASRVTINAETVNAMPGSTVGIDNSEKKSVEVG